MGCGFFMNIKVPFRQEQDAFSCLVLMSMDGTYYITQYFYLDICRMPVHHSIPRGNHRKQTVFITPCSVPVNCCFSHRINPSEGQLPHKMLLKAHS